MSQTNQNAIQLARGTLEQYKFELQKGRILVSQAVQELKQYTEQYQREDPLVVGIPTSMNPFKDKRPCSML
jgi:guanine nucleotide-binding protein G(I)/G(S)/G(O) subunit gamma-7